MHKEEAEYLTKLKQDEFNETRKVLDVLRSTRKARGGTGTPLDVPVHLKQAIVITDADLK